MAKKTAARIRVAMRPMSPSWFANCRLHSSSDSERVGSDEFSKRRSMASATAFGSTLSSRRATTQPTSFFA